MQPGAFRRRLERRIVPCFAIGSAAYGFALTFLSAGGDPDGPYHPGQPVAVSTPHIPSWCPGRLPATRRNRWGPAPMFVMRLIPGAGDIESETRLATRPDGRMESTRLPRVRRASRGVTLVRSAVFTSRSSDPTAHRPPVGCCLSGLPFTPSHCLHRRSGFLRAAARFRPGEVRPTEGPAVRSPGRGGALDGFWPRPVRWTLRGMRALRHSACVCLAWPLALTGRPPAGTVPGA